MAKDEFAYGPDGERYARKTVWKEGGTTKQEHVSYIGNTEYITYVNDPTMLATYKTRIGDNIMHIWSIGPNQYFDPYSSQYPYNEPYLMSETIEYAHRDHLGGVESVTDQYGNKLQQLAYEPFGSRKDSDWRQNIDSTELNNLLQNYLIFDYASFPYLYPYEPVPTVFHHARVARGFTGHEHLDRTGFIHMNGRVYDPELGRFLSPDPIVQAPTNSQNWNRYTYVFNNPLSLTDPTGFEIEETVTTGRQMACPPGYVRDRWGYCQYDWDSAWSELENWGVIDHPYGHGWYGDLPSLPPIDPAPEPEVNEECDCTCDAEVALALIQKHSDTIRKAGRAAGVNPQYVASIIFQEKYHGAAAAAKNALFAWPQIAIGANDASIGLAEMDVNTAARIMKVNPSSMNSRTRSRIIEMLYDDEIAIYLIAANVASFQSRLKREVTLQEATYGHNVGIDGLIRDLPISKGAPVSRRSWRCQNAIAEALK